MNTACQHKNACQQGKTAVLSLKQNQDDEQKISLESRLSGDVKANKTKTSWMDGWQLN